MGNNGFHRIHIAAYLIKITGQSLKYNGLILIILISLYQRYLYYNLKRNIFSETFLERDSDPL